MADEVKGDIHPDPLGKLLPTGSIPKSKEDNNRDKKKKAIKKTTKGTDAPGTGRTRIAIDDLKLPDAVESEGTRTSKPKPKHLKPVKRTKSKSPRKPVVVDLTEESTDKPTKRKLSGGRLPNTGAAETVKIEPPSEEDIKIDLKPTMFFKSYSTPTTPPCFPCSTFSIIDKLEKMCECETEKTTTKDTETDNKTINLSFYF